MTATRRAAASATADVYDVTTYGALGGGGNDTTAVEAALAAAMNAGGGTVYFPSRINCGIHHIDDVDSPNIRLVGGAGATITALDAPSFTRLRLVDCAEVTSLILDRVRIVIEAALPTSSGLKIHHNIFRNPNTGTAILGNTTSFAWPHAIQITNNTFDATLYGVNGNFSDSLISGNRFVNSTSRNIELWAGSNNQITDNYISGGVTGIIWLSNRSVTGMNGVYSNVMSGNTIENVSEESISFDCRGFNASLSAHLTAGTIASGLGVDGSGYVTFTPAFTMVHTVPSSYVGLAVIMTSGAAKGQCAIINDPSLSTFTIDTTNIADYTVGDSFVVGLVTRGNVISNNTTDGKGTGQTGINMYGYSCENVVTGNTCRDHTFAGIRTGTLYDNPFHTAPAFNNIITGNTVRNCGIQVRAFLAGAIEYKSIGVVITDNLLANGTLQYQHQEAFQVYDNTQISGGRTISDVGVPRPVTDAEADTGFETGNVAANFDTVTDTGTRLSIDSVIFGGGANSLKLTNGTGAAHGNFTTPASTRLVVMRLRFYMDATPSSTFAILSAVNTAATLEVDLMSTGKIRLFIGSNTFNPVQTLSTATWYWMDLRFDTSAATVTMDYILTRVSDGVVITNEGQYTHGGFTPADITQLTVGTNGTNNIQVHYDDVIYSTNTNDFPIGPVLTGTYIPVADGTWIQGQTVYNPNPVSGQSFGEVCTVSGNPGTWASLGTLP